MKARQYFDATEYELRLTAIASSMERREIDILCVTAPENIYYICGYDGWSFYTVQMLVVAPVDDVVLWIGRQMDVSCAKATTSLPEQDIIGYPDELVDRDSHHPMQFVANVLLQRGWGKRRIGIEFDSYFLTGRCLQELEASLPEATLVDATNLVNWVRVVKSPRELQYISEAAAIAGEAMHAGVQAMVPGARECDIAAEIVAAQIRGTTRWGGDPPCETIAMPSGQDVACPHLAWTDRELEANVPINLELGGVRHRYNAGIARSMFTGKAPQRLRDLSQATVDGLESLLLFVRPGVRACDVAAKYAATVAEHGERKSSRVGYSIGIGYPPVWIEHSVSLRVEDNTELVPDMTFHLMCGMWRQNDGFVQSETIRVTESGCEVLTQYPRGLIEL